MGSLGEGEALPVGFQAAQGGEGDFGELGKDLVKGSSEMESVSLPPLPTQGPQP